MFLIVWPFINNVLLIHFFHKAKDIEHTSAEAKNQKDYSKYRACFEVSIDIVTDYQWLIFQVFT